MDPKLTELVASLLAAAPCSVEMPAGTGKTHLLVSAVETAATDGERSLVLTHTNAGVAVIRERLKRSGIASNLFHVDTITSWAFTLVRAYPDIAELIVPEIPNWTDSDSYVRAATRVAAARSVEAMHNASFGVVFVDEYQDCTLTHHELIRALSAGVPRTIVFGDRLQAIFGFAGPLAEWDSHVMPVYKSHLIPHEPHRWREHNPALGKWLLDLRPSLRSGQSFDVTAHTVEGLYWVQDVGANTVATVASGFRNVDETVLVLDKWPKSVAQQASRLGGSFLVMEDIRGAFMLERLESIPAEGDAALAAWLARYAKDCMIGLSGIDVAILAALDENRDITHYARPAISDVLVALDRLRLNPTYAELASCSQAIRASSDVRLYRWEAWTDGLAAVELSRAGSESVAASLGRVRARLRHSGRRRSSRVASRTLLVKGLEYDHVIIADLSNFRDPRNLYVALSRARKSVTIVGRSSRVVLADNG